MSTASPDPSIQQRFNISPVERYAIGLILLLGLILSLAIAWLAQQAEYTRQQDLVNQQSARFANDLNIAFGVNIEILSGLRGLYLASTHVDLDEFNLYTQPIIRAHPEIQALAWAPRLKPNELATHERNMRQLGLTDYKAHQHIQPQDTSPLAQRDEYFPIAYLSPFIGNENYLGQDLAATPALHKAMYAARDSGLPTLSAPYTFQNDEQVSFMLVIPIYSVKNLLLSQELRKKNLTGFVMASYRIIDLFYLATTHLDSEAFNIVINDVTERQPITIIDQPSDLPVNPLAQASTQISILDIAGRRWELALSDARTYPLADAALLLFGSGVFITLLIISFLLRNSHWRRIAEQQVLQRTLELDSLQKRSELILNSTGEGIVGLDNNGYTTFINNAAQHILGYSFEELRSQPQHDLIHHHFPDGRDYPRRECNIYRAFTEGVTTTTDQEVFWRKDGSSYPIEYTSTPIRDENGDTQGAVVLFRDISERKVSEQQLIDARIHAEDASRAKSAFLATMSHEIRTPMNGMLGMAQLLAATSLDATQKDYIDTLLKSGKALLTQVNDILDFSRIEADRLTLDDAPFDLHEICDTLIRLQQPSAATKKLTLNWNYPSDCPRYFMGDSMRIRQIILNLVSNAIKFTHRGSVDLQIQCAQQDKDQAKLRILVKDTGIGMEPNTLKKLFNPFSQADTSTTRQYGGSGLGLAISKRLAELMNAKLEVSSILNEGSIFTFNISLATSDKVITVIPQANTLATPLRGHVLLAEDNQTNRRVAEAMLQNMGLTVTCAENGLLALQQFGMSHFDIVLMDCQMPVMDGYQASRLLRKANIEVPILALTANVLPEDMTRCIEAGMNDCIRKPIEVNSFRQTMARWLKVHDEEVQPVIIVNTQHLDNMANLMGAMFSELIPAWLRETEKYMVQMQLAIQQQDFAALIRVSHALKASSGNVGATEISQLTSKLERVAQEKNIERCGVLLDTIQQQFPIAKKLLLAYHKAKDKQMIEAELGAKIHTKPG